MISVILGIKDYIKDCWNDYVEIPRWKRRIKKKGIIMENAYMIPYKEGSVWHYIRQRRIAKRIINENKIRI